MARFADVDEMSAAFVELEAIVRDLADEADVYVEGDIFQGWGCRYCGEPRPPAGEHGLAWHDPTCEHRRARAWVSAHPVPGDLEATDG